MKHAIFFSLWWALVLAIFAAPSLPAATSTSRLQSHPVTIPLRFDFYYSYDMVIEALEKLHRAYPGLTGLDLVGKSEEGRSIYCMTVNNPKTGNPLDKPGIYVDGNIHGNEIQGTEVTLYLLDYLLGNYGKNPEITALVDKKCFYLVPMVNPDGRYHFFADGNTDSSNRSLRRPHDDDHDGLVDEDFPDDLDGDGNICWMRKKDPFGRYKTDPEDPRLMVEVKPGEKGEWRLLGSEGIDNDGDGKVNEDSEGYVDPNRNWPFEWMPPYVQAGAGDYPLSGTGLKALANYIEKRPNICMVWAFHNYGGMFLRGPSTKTEQAYPLKDVAVYDYLGKQAERITPGYQYLVSWESLYSTYGDFGEWMVTLHGCYTFVGELFITSQESFKTYEESTTGREKEKEDKDYEEGFDFLQGTPEQRRERLKFNDHLTQGELFKPWKPFKHPTYGDIEIGGWVKFSSRMPAPFMIREMVHRNASAVIFSAKQTPEVTMEVLDTRSLGKNLYRLRVRLANAKAIPTMSYHALQVSLYPQDTLKVSGKGMRIPMKSRIKSTGRRFNFSLSRALEKWSSNSSFPEQIHSPWTIIPAMPARSSKPCIYPGSPIKKAESGLILGFGFDFHQDCIIFHYLAGIDVNGFYYPPVAAADLILHFHGFNNNDTYTRLDKLPFLHQDFNYFPRHGGFNDFGSGHLQFRLYTPHTHAAFVQDLDIKIAVPEIQQDIGIVTGERNIVGGSVHQDGEQIRCAKPGIHFMGLAIHHNLQLSQQVNRQADHS